MINKPKLIIVEGPDCSGKSTLARYLAQRLNAIYWHMTCSPCLAQAMPDYMHNSLKNAEWNMMHRGQSVVFDRHWPSEVVYGRVLRPSTIFPQQTFQQWVLSLNGIYVYCHRKGVVEVHRQEKDASHPYDEELFQKIVMGYNGWWLAHAGDPNMIEYDFDKEAHDLSLVLKKVEAL